MFNSHIRAAEREWSRNIDKAIRADEDGDHKAAKRYHAAAQKATASREALQAQDRAEAAARASRRGQRRR